MTRWSHGSRSVHAEPPLAEGEVKAILEEAAPMATKAEALAIVDRWQRYWKKGKTFSDSAELIREDRDGGERIVLDASVAVKWVLREEHGATARRVLATSELLAPLLWAEVGNTLWKRHRRPNRLSRKCDVCSLKWRLPVTTFAHWPLLAAAVDLGNLARSDGLRLPVSGSRREPQQRHGHGRPAFHEVFAPACGPIASCGSRTCHDRSSVPGRAPREGRGLADAGPAGDPQRLRRPADRRADQGWSDLGPTMACASWS